MRQGKKKISHKKKPDIASAGIAKGPEVMTDDMLKTANISTMTRDELVRTLTMLECTEMNRMTKPMLIRLSNVQRRLLIYDTESDKPVDGAKGTVQRGADPEEIDPLLKGGTGTGQKSGGLKLADFDNVLDKPGDGGAVNRGADPAKTTKSSGGETGNDHTQRNSWENQIKLQGPKIKYDGSGSYTDWLRGISIWASLYTNDQGNLSAKQDRILGLSLMESITGNASKTVFARVSPGEETYTGIMSILKDCFGSNSMPEALEAYRKFVEYKRKGGETLKEYINSFISLHSKSLSTGNDSSDKTLGLMLLEKSMCSAQLMAQIMTTCQTVAGGLIDNKFPKFELVLQLLRTFSDSYETTAGISGGKSQGKGGSKALFTTSGGGLTTR